MGLSVSKNVYETHFGLLEFPFSITPDPRFSYDNSLYREAFAKLCHGIEARKGFIVITGEVGTGKTTLLKAFMQSVESTVHTAFIFNPKLNFNQLLRSILIDLGIAYSRQDRFTLIAKLNDYLIEQFKKDHIVAILVDEAQDLSDELLEELRLLSNLETDRSRLIQIVLMGQPEFEQRLDQPGLRQLKQRIALRCRLAALPSNEVGSYINSRLKTAGYQGKELFEARAIERISFNSQGIPRLINVICDNALLIAYASAKRQVSAEMVEEVAHDLKLTVPSKTQLTGSVVDLHTPRGRDELTLHPMWADVPTGEEPPEFEKFFMEEVPRKRYPKSRVKGVGIGILLVLVLMTGIGAVIYSSQENRNFASDIQVTIQDVSQQSGNYISDVAAKVQQRGRGYLSDAAVKAAEYSEQSRHYLSDLIERVKENSPLGTNYLSDLAAAMGAHFERIRDSFSDAAVKIGDYLPRARGYLSGLAVSAKSSVTTQWENLRKSNLVSKTVYDNSPNIGLADFHDLKPNDHQAAVKESALVTEPSKEAELNKNVAPVPDSEKITETQTPKTPTALTDGAAITSATNGPPKTQLMESQIAALKSEPPLLDRQITPNREQPSFLGNFEVVQDSFLRDKPESDAAITTLSPGIRVRVESKNGDYLRVRSLDDPTLHGYVHREDAFFERIR
jgi:general secretion pathway protein A